MKAKGRNMTKEMTLLLSFVSVLVFCSFVVSYQITDILYFLVLISHMLYYKVRKSEKNETLESIDLE